MKNSLRRPGDDPQDPRLRMVSPFVPRDEIIGGDYYKINKGLFVKLFKGLSLLSPPSAGQPEASSTWLPSAARLATSKAGLRMRLGCRHLYPVAFTFAQRLWS